MGRPATRRSAAVGDPPSPREAPGLLNRRPPCASISLPQRTPTPPNLFFLALSSAPSTAPTSYSEASRSFVDAPTGGKRSLPGPTSSPKPASTEHAYFDIIQLHRPGPSHSLFSSFHSKRRWGRGGPFPGSPFASRSRLRITTCRQRFCLSSVYQRLVRLGVASTTEIRVTNSRDALPGRGHQQP